MSAGGGTAAVAARLGLGLGLGVRAQEVADHDDPDDHEDPGEQQRQDPRGACSQPGASAATAPAIIVEAIFP
jgi:hypothetical protein